MPDHGGLAYRYSKQTGPGGRGDLSGSRALAGHGGHGGFGGFGGSTGITRLFGPQFGGQVAWLLPAALLAAVALLWVSRRGPRTD